MVKNAYFYTLHYIIPMVLYRCSKGTAIKAEYKKLQKKMLDKPFKKAYNKSIKKQKGSFENVKIY